MQEVTRCFAWGGEEEIVALASCKAFGSSPGRALATHAKPPCPACAPLVVAGPPCLEVHEIQRSLGELYEAPAVHLLRGCIRALHAMAYGPHPPAPHTDGRSPDRSPSRSTSLCTPHRERSPRRDRAPGTGRHRAGAKHREAKGVGKGNKRNGKGTSVGTKAPAGALRVGFWMGFLICWGPALNTNLAARKADQKGRTTRTCMRTCLLA